METKYRHEVKHVIDRFKAAELRPRLRAVMHSDSHARNGVYFIRSLYFDDGSDSALREKLDGVSRREKFRIRFYNGDLSFIMLEKKFKLGGLCAKGGRRGCRSRRLAPPPRGDLDILALSAQPLVRELRAKMQCRGLRAKTVVDYMREPFIYVPGNVRVTLDGNIRTALRRIDAFSPDLVTVPAGEDVIVLEVKWDEYLPSVIRDIIQLPAERSCAVFSQSMRHAAYIADVPVPSQYCCGAEPLITKETEVLNYDIQ